MVDRLTKYRLGAVQMLCVCMFDVWLSLGESNVYTIGYIGQHKVVSTKLPAVGRQMAAQISSGNTTTRLLGISCCYHST